MSLATLAELPDRVHKASAQVEAFDRCLLVGAGRLGPEQHQALASLSRILSGTPLASAITHAATALARSEFVDRHFVVLAAARSALHAAMYDALRAELLLALGRADMPGTVTESATPASPEGPVAVWLESARNWLMEIALAGFRQLEPNTLLPFLSTLEHIQSQPQLARVGTLLTGFLHELLDAMPLSSLPEIPLARWADLWSRAMLLCVAPIPSPPTQTVKGQLTFLGAQLHHHGYSVCAELFALLEPSGGNALLTRVCFSGYKVSVLNGADLWCCLSKTASEAIRGVSQKLSFRISDMPILPSGDLLWEGKIDSGREVNTYDILVKKLAVGSPEAPLSQPCPPFDRHPVQVGELAFLGPYTVTPGADPTLEFSDGAKLPVALRRLSGSSEITRDHVVASQRMLGRVCFDGGRWEVVPLLVSLEGKKPQIVYTGSEAARIRKSGSEVLSTLAERASRLLRQKA